VVDGLMRQGLAWDVAVLRSLRLFPELSEAARQERGPIQYPYTIHLELPRD
jgi:hypothetical protein